MEIRDIKLKVGEDYRLRLKGFGTAGYSWHYTVEGDIKAIEVSSEKLDIGGVEKQLLTRTGSLDELFRIHALGVGRTRIHFKQYRSWEKDKRPPLNELIIQVTIDDPV